MDLLSDAEKTVYSSVIDDISDTFSRDITIINKIKIPINEVSPQEDDNYDFVNDKKTSSDENNFTYSHTETIIKARIKYIEKQETDYLLALAQINSVSLFGLIRIKVKITDADAVAKADNITVDGNNCKITFRDMPHGLFTPNYATFFLERVV